MRYSGGELYGVGMQYGLYVLFAFATMQLFSVEQSQSIYNKRLEKSHFCISATIVQ